MNVVYLVELDMICVHNIVFISIICIVCVNGILFHAVPNGQKCLREEIRQNVLIVGEYEVSHAPGQKIDYVVCIFTFLELCRLSLENFTWNCEL